MTTGAALATSARRSNGAGATRAALWVMRVALFIAVSVISMTGRDDHRGAVIASLAVAAVTFVAWAAIDFDAWRVRQRVPMWVLAVLLIAMGCAGGVVTALPEASSLVTFALLASGAAGSDLPFGGACAVGATSVVATEVSYLCFGSGVGDVGWPFAVLACMLLGRQRRDARALNAQALALVDQAEQTQAEHQRAATLDERARIAREIHDLLAHSLGALGIQIEAAQALLTDSGDVDQAIRLLDQARRLTTSGLQETRGAIEALRTDTPPLPESLSSLAEGHLAQHSVPVEVTVTGAPRPLSPDANLALIRTAREALTNAAKHAPSSPIAIALDYAGDQTTMTVTNGRCADGQVLAVPNGGIGVSGGYGLAGMRERLLLIGGTLAAGESELGWTVKAEVPL
jgi:signal transduction histidine kinase